MAKVSFDSGTVIDVNAGTKILAAALKAKEKIRFGCGACRCGTCAVRIEGDDLSVMEVDELALLSRLHLSTDGDIRLSCRVKVGLADCRVDLGFQQTYSPEDLD
jgi:ferredoxin